jgi:serine/threonine-protein kinase HipA
VNGFARYPNVEQLSISLNLQGSEIEVGALAWSRKENLAYFEYCRDFIDRRLPISPFKLPLKSDATPAPRTPFGGLHGLFNDSLPDGWGRWLLDRLLRRRNFNKDDLTPVDRLTYVGAHGMGALTYVPKNAFTDPKTGESVDLDWLAAQAQKVETEFGDADVDRLYELQGASGGARPKIMIGRHPSTGQMVPDVGKGLPEGYEPWIVKFRSKANDHAEVGAEEYAYSRMATACGITMPDTALLKGNRGRYFAVRRFDRSETGRLHVQTASALLEVDHHVPQIDYETLLKLVRALTRDSAHVQQVFRRMVFNVLARNRDDHSKNHAFQMDGSGIWTPTPAYDLTLSAGPGGQHSLAVAGEGKEPGYKHITDEAVRASIPKGEAETIYQQVLSVVDKWPLHAEKAGLSEQRIEDVDYLLNRRGRPPKRRIELATQPPSP